MLKLRKKSHLVSGTNFFMIPDFLRDKMSIEAYIHDNHLYVEMVNKISSFVIDPATPISIVIEDVICPSSFTMTHYEKNDLMVIKTNSTVDDFTGNQKISIIFGNINPVQMDFETEVYEFDDVPNI